MVSPRIASLVILHISSFHSSVLKAAIAFLPHALVMSIRGSCTKVTLSPVLHPPLPPSPKTAWTVVGHHKSSNSAWASFLVYHSFLRTHSSRAVQEALTVSQETSLPPGSTLQTCTLLGMYWVNADEIWR